MAQDWIEDQIEDDAVGVDTELPAAGREIHVIHRYDRPQRAPTVKLAKNSRGYTWEITYTGSTLADTLAVLRHTDDQLQAQYGS